MTTQELKNTLKHHRSKANLTQQAMADRTQVSRKTINTIENSVFVPSTVLALKIARVLNLRVEDIFTLAETEKTGDPDKG